MDRLLSFTGQDPAVRAEATLTVDQPALGLRRDGRWAVAFVRPTHTHGISLMLRGDAPLLRELAASSPFASWSDRARAKGAGGVTMSRAVEDIGLIAGEPSRWEFMSTTEVVPVAAPRGLVELPAADRAEIQALLDEHNPGTDGQPFARPRQRWVGVRDERGALLAVGCCEPESSGAPVLAGITVVPSARGLGLGRAVTAELTRVAVAEHGWSTLGMYSRNDRAREVYRSLGYVVHAEWSSGRLA